ncbi:hypothetical protein O4H49_08120 [Kiloniella laminariae]|uniref:Uncharacterized protein n=1 Tax=Kiloniella laminariae TaxID=454162 RepID=A0ABT4LIH8_9PROT|nr:hypothetical protein [Kiloniella laminariae]MCZ4280740.1 hypothetical protein [Kiloniella laminariae]
MSETNSKDNPPNTIRQAIPLICVALYGIYAEKYQLWLLEMQTSEKAGKESVNPLPLSQKDRTEIVRDQDDADKMGGIKIPASQFRSWRSAKGVVCGLFGCQILHRGKMHGKIPLLLQHVLDITATLSTLWRTVHGFIYTRN